MGSPNRRWPLFFLASLVAVYGCALVPERFRPTEEPAPAAGPDYPAALDQGGAALMAGEYRSASEQLGSLAARCESGDSGRRAVLLLATAALDPRNPTTSPDTAAALAAHILMLPGAERGQRITAETLYLLALDRGARPFSAGPSDGLTFEPPLAARYVDCDASRVAGDTAASDLPSLPGRSTDDRLARLQAVRDSLTRQVGELETELERIRGLLRQGILPDTSGTR